MDFIHLDFSFVSSNCLLQFLALSSLYQSQGQSRVDWNDVSCFLFLLNQSNFLNCYVIICTILMWPKSKLLYVWNFIFCWGLRLGISECFAAAQFLHNSGTNVELLLRFGSGSNSTTKTSSKVEDCPNPYIQLQKTYSSRCRTSNTPPTPKNEHLKREVYKTLRVAHRAVQHKT